jgi:S-DNA-T family DNA segregation ATPase FtsK/SpoIIIE
MAGRTPPAGRSRAASTTRGAAVNRARQPARKATRKAATRKTTAKRPAVRKQPPVVGPSIARGVGSLWMGMAGGVGWLARGAGRQATSAKSIGPEHRRDGAGLFLLGAAILIAVAVWAGSAGPVGVWVADMVRLFLGNLAVLLPLLLFFGAIRLMREPADPEHRGRSLVGWTAIIVATAALLHISGPASDRRVVCSASGSAGCWSAR